MSELTGSCLCGAVRYRISGALVQANGFEWTQGQDLIADYRSSTDMHRMFCRTCGSHLAARSDAHPAIVSIAAGTLDGAPSVRPTAHWNVASKASWFEITDALPQHAVLPPR
jgi:hypothetical protein